MSKESKPPQISLRTCVGCHVIDKKENLLRLGMLPDKQIVIDRKGDLSGRGAYVCDLQCLEKATRENKLNKAFRQKVKTDLLASNQTS